MIVKISSEPEVKFPGLEGDRLVVRTSKYTCICGILYILYSMKYILKIYEESKYYLLWMIKFECSNQGEKNTSEKRIKGEIKE